MSATRTGRAAQAALTAADRMHPVALLLLVLVLAALGLAALPFLTAAVTALVTAAAAVAKAAVLTAAAGLLGRMAFRLAGTVRPRSV